MNRNLSMDTDHELSVVRGRLVYHYACLTYVLLARAGGDCPSLDSLLAIERGRLPADSVERAAFDQEARVERAPFEPASA